SLSSTQQVKRILWSNIPPNLSFGSSSEKDSALTHSEVLQQCLEANFTRALARRTAEPVKIGLYYESLCPGCRNFITSMLYPTSVLLGDIMDLTLVPYGNAQETFDGEKYIFKCQHGEGECMGNMIEACLLNLTDSNAFLTIFCMESSGDPVKACVELFLPNLSWKQLMTCVNGDSGNQIMHQTALKTQALKPPHDYVPWITINGVRPWGMKSSLSWDHPGRGRAGCVLMEGERHRPQTKGLPVRK
uniref:Gamma-interferon-inducible lysosomal thiol reductase n=1 Tax=Neogobius melanostomus TaxID=47308 RepID=A0A8C6U1V5_9GOBI